MGNKIAVELHIEAEYHGSNRHEKNQEICGIKR
jgi:hypothetical protein